MEEGAFVAARAGFFSLAQRKTSRLIPLPAFVLRRFAAMPAHKQGLALGILGVVVLSPDSLVLRLMESDDYAVIAMRSLFLALPLGLCALVFPALRRGLAWRAVALYAAFFSVGSACFVLSIKHTHVANVLVILSIAPLLAAVLAYIVLREKTAKATWLAAAVVAFGVALIFSGSWRTGGVLGNLFAFAAALTLAANSVVVRKNPGVPLFIGLALGGAFLAAVFALFADWQSASAADWALGALNGGVITALSFVLIIAAGRRLPPAEVNLFFLLEAVLGPLWVWLALGEVPPKATFAAAALILPALALHAVWRARASAKTARQAAGEM